MALSTLIEILIRHSVNGFNYFGNLYVGTLLLELYIFLGEIVIECLPLLFACLYMFLCIFFNGFAVVVLIP